MPQPYGTNVNASDSTMPLSNIDPERYPDLLAEKSRRVSELLAPYEVPEAEVFPSPPTAFRMRAEFRMWHDGDGITLSDAVYITVVDDSRPGSSDTEVTIPRS